MRRSATKDARCFEKTGNVTVGVAGWIGSAGAGLVILTASRSGCSVPLAIALTAVGTWSLHYSGSARVYVVACWPARLLDRHR
jgi:hypothetical protein